MANGLVGNGSSLGVEERNIGSPTDVESVKVFGGTSER